MKQGLITSNLKVADIAEKVKSEENPDTSKSYNLEDEVNQLAFSSI